jgi:predicted nucleic acid-binding protein
MRWADPWTRTGAAALFACGLKLFAPADPCFQKARRNRKKRSAGLGHDEQASSTVVRVVLDASVVVRALVSADSAAAEWVERLGDEDTVASEPDLLFVEAAQTLLGYSRSGLLAPDVARLHLEFVTSLPLFVWPSQELAGAAFDVALTRDLSISDACYAALAEAEDAVLVTADRRLASAVERVELLT